MPPGSSFVDSPDFASLAPHIRIETYARDGGHERPRKRIELATKAPPNIVSAALKMKMPCVACGRSIHPFRQRVAASKRSHHAHVYFAAACPLETSIACSRGREARDEYLRVVEAVCKVTRAPDPQLALFGEAELQEPVIFVGEVEDEMIEDDVTEKPEPAEVAAMRLSAGAGIFDESAIPSARQDREDQLMGALMVLRSDVDTLRWQVRALYLAVTIIIVVIMGATYVVLR
jgi:hypothetical protein